MRKRRQVCNEKPHELFWPVFASPRFLPLPPAHPLLLSSPLPSSSLPFPSFSFVSPPFCFLSLPSRPLPSLPFHPLLLPPPFPFFPAPLEISAVGAMRNYDVFYEKTPKNKSSALCCQCPSSVRPPQNFKSPRKATPKTRALAAFGGFLPQSAATAFCRGGRKLGGRWW